VLADGATRKNGVLLTLRFFVLLFVAISLLRKRTTCMLEEEYSRQYYGSNKNRDFEYARFAYPGSTDPGSS
jgi:hypothetical protein